MASSVRKIVERSTARLRYPWLFVLTVVLFVADLAIPDVIPFVDEILLGLGAVILARLRVRRTTSATDDETTDGS
jgi:hypothetical protein